jgi:hypothetical protein
MLETIGSTTGSMMLARDEIRNVSVMVNHETTRFFYRCNTENSPTLHPL